MCSKSPICQTPKHCFIHLLQPVTIPGVNCNFNMLLISMLMYYSRRMFFLLHMLFFINLKCFFLKLLSKVASAWKHKQWSFTWCDSRVDEDVDNHRDDEDDTEIHVAQEPVNGNADKEDFGNYNIMKQT